MYSAVLLVGVQQPVGCILLSDTQVAKGYKLDKPRRCPQAVYKLMRNCWKMVRVDSVEECLSLQNITFGILEVSVDTIMYQLF